LSTAFAYEGWIIATTINAELKDTKKTLPRALVAGTLAIMLIYMLYYLGLSGVLSNERILAAGDGAPVEVMSLVFGRIGGTLLTVFVVISCLGTLNELIMGSSRGMYSIASRNMGPGKSFFSKLSESGSTLNSGLAGYLLSAFWLMVWYGNFNGWWGGFMDISELSIAFLYLVYTLLYLWFIKTFKELSFFQRVVVPLLAGTGSLYIILGAIQKDMFMQFALLTVIILTVGWVMRKPSDKKAETV